MHFDCLTLGLEVSVGVAVGVAVEVEAEVESGKALPNPFRPRVGQTVCLRPHHPNSLTKSFARSTPLFLSPSLSLSLLPQEVARSTLQLDAAQKLELPPVNAAGIHNEFCNYVTCPGVVLAASS